jgi:predicted SAM-dependent methyltransferase
MKQKKILRNLVVLLILLVAAIALVTSGYLEKMVRGSSTAYALSRPVYDWWRTASRMAVGKYRSSFRDPGTISTYIQTHEVRKLQIGSGGKQAEGWLNSDFEPAANEIYLDATERFPMPDGSFHYVFSEHMIEHVPFEGGLAMLKECYRVLAPGGKVRTITPDLSKFIQLMTEGVKNDETQRFVDAKLRFHSWPVTSVPGAYILNRQVRDFGHQFLYDKATLRKSLELAGFSKITEYSVGEASDPVFQQVEDRMRDPKADIYVINRWEAMAFEAVR